MTTIESANRDIALTNFILAAVLVVFAGVSYWYISSKVHIDFHSPDSIPLIGIPGAILLFALFYLGSAVLNGARVAKSGKSFMDVEEAAYGKCVRGRIRTERALEATGDYTLLLECIEHFLVTVPTRQGTTRSEDQRAVRWQTTQTVKSEGVSSTAGIPVNIAVESFPWPHTPRSQGIHWELTVKAPLRGLNYSAVFGLTMHGEPPK
jgi:hypothetical protein